MVAFPEGLPYQQNHQTNEPAWVSEIRASQQRIEAQLLMLTNRLATNPVELAEALGKGIAAAQGLGGEAPESPVQPDLIVTPGLVAYEPENEAWDREAPDWTDDAANQSWWETMTPGEPAPPGEPDSEGP